MIAIKVGEVFLDMRQDQKMRLKLRSQIFHRDFVAAGYTYPFTLPYTPTNARALRYYNRLGNPRKIEDIECELWLGGAFWRMGLMKYKRFEGGYDVDVLIPEDEAILQLRKVRTKDLTDEYDWVPDPFGTEETDMQTVLTRYSGTIEDTDIVLPPFRNTGKFGGRKETYFGVDPASPEGAGNKPFNEWQNTYRWAVEGGIELYFNEYTPMPYLVRVFEKMMALVGKRVTGDVVDDPEVRSMIIFNNLHVPLMIQVLFGGVPSYQWVYQLRQVMLRDMLPNLTGLDFMIRMMRRFNAIPFFRDGGRLEFRSMNHILADNRYKDLTEHVVPSKNMEVEEFGGLLLKEQKEPLEKSRSTVTFERSKVIGTVTTVAGLASLTPTVGDLARVNSLDAIFIYREQPGLIGPAWSYLTDDLSELSTGDDPKSQDIGVGFVSMYKGAGIQEDQLWLVPTTSMVMTDPSEDMHGIGSNEMQQLILLFHRGEQLDSLGNPYVLASNDTFNYAGGTIEGATMRERLGGDGGIYDVWYKRWAEAQADGKYVKRRLRLPLHMVRSWQWDTIIMLEGQKFLAKDMDIEVTPSGHGLVSMELMRLAAVGARVVPVVFACSGPGYIAMVKTGTGSAYAETTSGYYSVRTPDGTVVTLDSGTSFEDDDAGTYCIWCSDADGELDGAYTYLSFGGDITELLMAGIEGMPDLEEVQVLGTLISELVFPLFGTVPYVLLQNSPITLLLFASGQKFANLNCSGCALTEASIDHVILRAHESCVAGAVPAAVELTGGTNASPVGTPTLDLIDEIVTIYGGAVATN